LNFYQRSDTLGTADDLHASVFYRTTNRRLDYAIDTTAYELRSVGFTTRKWLDAGNISAEAGLDYAWFFKNRTSYPTLQYQNWGLVKGEGKAAYRPFPFIMLQGGAAYQYRSDGFNQYRLAFGPKIEAGNFVFEGGVALGTIMPT